MKYRMRFIGMAAVCGLLMLGSLGHGFDESSQSAIAKKKLEPKPSRKSLEPIPLNKQRTVLLDQKGKRLLLKAKVVLREGALEMLCCRAQTKEHESILSVDTRAIVVHAGLIALGAKPGFPVKFFPEYKPAKGPRIDIFLQWKDKQGKPHRVAAQNWVRHSIFRFYGQTLKQLPAGVRIPEKGELRYDAKHQELSWYGPMTADERDDLLKLTTDEPFQKAIRTFFKKSQPRQMKTHWIFGGSGFYVDEKTGKRAGYMAEGGDLICVANFPTAMIDVAVKSSSSGEANLLYEADTEKIPPVGTDVTMELIPVFEKIPPKK